jgi:NitT/TauT family transport system substrate-binding protein
MGFKAAGVIALAVLLGFLAGCASAPVSAGPKAPLKIGTLSMMTVLPLHVGVEEGLFAAQGVNVEIVPFRSQIERDTALSAGQIDGIVEDIYSAPVLDRDTDLVKVVAVSPVRSYMFALIAGKDSSIKSASDLENAEVALSLGNIIEYVTDQLSRQGGLAPAALKKVSVPSMPLRLEMLNQGKIDVATFSRPLSDMALETGGRLVLDDSQQSLLTSAIMISSDALKSRAGDVRSFLKGWSLACQEISAAPVSYRDLLVKVAAISPDIAATISVPPFDALRLPTRAEYQDKLEWNLANHNITRSIAFEDIVASGYLP